MSDLSGFDVLVGYVVAERDMFDDKDIWIRGGHDDNPEKAQARCDHLHANQVARGYTGKNMYFVMEVRAKPLE